MKSTGDPLIDALYSARKGKVEYVDVPELGFLVIDGVGDPSGEAFHDAIQALYSVSYGAHFALKKATGEAPRVMALEGLWWVEGADAQATMERIAAGEASMQDSDRDQWHWRAMIVQLAPIDAAMIEQAVTEAKAKKDIASLSALRYERWAEGPSAQIMHIGLTPPSPPASLPFTGRSPSTGPSLEAGTMRSTSGIHARRRRRSSARSCASRLSRHRTPRSRTDLDWHLDRGLVRRC